MIERIYFNRRRMMYPPRNPMVPIFNKGWSNRKLILISLAIFIIPVLSAIPAIIWN